MAAGWARRPRRRSARSRDAVVPAKHQPDDRSVRTSVNLGPADLDAEDADVVARAGLGRYPWGIGDYVDPHEVAARRRESELHRVPLALCEKGIEHASVDCDADPDGIVVGVGHHRAQRQVHLPRLRRHEERRAPARPAIRKPVVVFPGVEAERERVEFQRKMAKYVGAPLLGAFSCAMGATLFAQIVNPVGITGAPISWIFGGNPVLDGVWLFANGVICFHQGYKFFMIALADQEEVNRVVREIKGLLPAA